MNRGRHNPIYLADYQPPAFLIEEIHLSFFLSETKTKVRAISSVRKNPDSSFPAPDLFLDGDTLELTAISLDNQTLSPESYELSETGLTIKAVPDAFTLDITTRINPQANTALSGLYLSSAIFCTQCEAEGFRRITFFLDRPDVLCRYTTRIEADIAQAPVLLSNGNLVNSGELKGNRHFAQWHDPYPKPSYLFALVAGDLVVEEGTFLTKSQRQVELGIYVQPKNQHKCAHAMHSLKKAMAWDEQKYGLEYDLDRYMIVAVDDFNMGAMENKGLNVFNSKYVLARPESATDQDYLGIEGVIAHEYFHNWTGNRVTCRDWFQLSLKEGLTVFRDQQFSGDMNSTAVQRIKDVKILRQFQFREDAGPMAHPVRPASYMEINNFYTVTVYNKGAEVVRMIHTLLGEEGFRKGMDLYFQRHDGQAVTCNDFLAALSSGSGIDLQQFERWYSQAGTPRITVQESWDERSNTLTLTLGQQTAPTPEQTSKEPFHMPILLGFLDQTGSDITAEVANHYPRRGKDALIELKEAEQSFVFRGFTDQPKLSILRNFSAPVRIEPHQTTESLAFLMSHDSDLFNRWDAAFTLSSATILEIVAALTTNRRAQVDPTYVEAFRTNLVTDSEDKSLTALALQLPDDSYLAQALEVVDPDSLFTARMIVKQEIAQQLWLDLVDAYEANSDSGGYQLTSHHIGRRALRNLCLGYLVSVAENQPRGLTLCQSHYYQSDNMTEKVGALASICDTVFDLRHELLDDFEKTWYEDALVMDKWFSIQAGSSASDTFEQLQRLLDHPLFTLKNPNRVRALIGSFTANHYHFHRIDGQGYQFLGDMIIQLDTLNPQIAARLTSPLSQWRRYDEARQERMRAELERIQRKEAISRDVYELVIKSLAGA